MFTHRSARWEECPLFSKMHLSLDFEKFLSVDFVIETTFIWYFQKKEKKGPSSIDLENSF